MRYHRLDNQEMGEGGDVPQQAGSLVMVCWWWRSRGPWEATLGPAQEDADGIGARW